MWISFFNTLSVNDLDIGTIILMEKTKERLYGVLKTINKGKGKSLLDCNITIIRGYLWHDYIGHPRYVVKHILNSMNKTPDKTGTLDMCNLC